MTTGPPTESLHLLHLSQGANTKKKKVNLRISDIGSPSNFKHIGHISWDPQKCLDMDLSNLDDQGKMIFSKHSQNSELPSTATSDKYQSSDRSSPPLILTSQDENKKSKKRKRITADIGYPTNFQHAGHISWDPKNGLQMNLSKPNDEWKTIFSKHFQNSELPSTATSDNKEPPDGMSSPLVVTSQNTNKKSTQSKIASDIGYPTNFRHVSHISWNPEEGFELDVCKLNNEWIMMVSKNLLSSHEIPFSANPDISHLPSRIRGRRSLSGAVASSHSPASLLPPSNELSKVLPSAASLRGFDTPIPLPDRRPPSLLPSSALLLEKETTTSGVSTPLGSDSFDIPHGLKYHGNLLCPNPTPPLSMESFQTTLKPTSSRGIRSAWTSANTSHGSENQWKWKPVSIIHRDKYKKLLQLQHVENSQKIKKINGVRVCCEDEFKVGQGADGTSVYIGLSEDGYERAVKRLVKNVSGQLGLHEQNVLNTLNAVDSKYVVRYWFYDEDSDEGFAYLMLDLCEETLEHHVKNQSQEKLDENALVIIRQILEALNDLHRKPTPVLHRDLKPSNILRNIHDKWLLADFGLSRTLSEEQTTHQSEERGTKFWRAVESYPIENGDDNCFNKVRFKRKSDVQSAGMVIFHVLTKGKHAFGPERRRLDNLLDGKPVGLTNLTNPVAKDLISWMLQHKPDDRPYAHEALKHPYLLPPDQQFELLKCVGNEPEIKDTKTTSDVAKKINADPLLPKSGWISHIHSDVLYFGCGKYPYPNRWSQCLRFIRNVSVHWNDKPKPATVQNVVVEPREYFLKVFPILPTAVHQVLRNEPDWRERETLKKFF